ncbi:MAG: hypothetical protein FJ312_00795 [SAR202 cluster bacterium]|nr:hypothetical protein [SAR202 cluster bacterium]
MDQKKQNGMSRRDFLVKASLGLLAVAGVAAISGKLLGGSKRPAQRLSKDSIFTAREDKGRTA